MPTFQIIKLLVLLEQLVLDNILILAVDCNYCVVDLISFQQKIRGYEPV